MKKTINRRKSTYEIDPAKRALNKAFNSLSLTEKSIYSFLLDSCWLGECQYMIDIDESSWSLSLGVTEDEISNFIESVTQDIEGIKLAEQSFNLETSEFQLIIYDLKEQIEFYNAWAIKEEELTKKKNALERKSIGLLDIASNRESALEGAVHYLEPGQRHMEHYLGWFPTVGFDNAGQVYRIRKFVVKQLQEMYPTADIDVELRKMFEWFSNPRNRRRTVAQMNAFIHNWIENSTKGWVEKPKTDFNLDDEVNKLIEDDLNKAANE
jgi:hypothetical protein